MPHVSQRDISSIIAEVLTPAEHKRLENILASADSVTFVITSKYGDEVRVQVDE